MSSKLIGIDDTEERLATFHRRISREHGSNTVIAPTVYMQASKGCEGIARHLVHDCNGYVIKEEEMPFGNCIVAAIPPSAVELFEKIAKEHDYISHAEFSFTSTQKRTIK